MISIIDVLIVIVYLASMILIGYFMGRKNETSNDLLVGKKSMNWLPVMLSVTATMISSNALIGGPGWTYTSRLNAFMVNFSVPIAIIFALTISAPLMYCLDVNSVYEYAGLRFGEKSRILCLIQFFINTCIQLSSVIFIPTLFISTITGWKMTTVIPIIVLVSISYTMLGGIKAVIYTDAIQTLVILVGVMFMMFNLISNIGTGVIEPIEYAGASGKLNMINLSLDLVSENTLWAALFGGTIMWIRYFSFDQVQVQRIITAKSLTSVKKSLAVSAILMNLVYFLILFIGIYLWTFLGGKAYDNSNLVMIDYIINYLPIGIVGLILSATFAAAMSSIDSNLNSMTAVLVNDVLKLEDISKKQSVLILGAIGVVITIFIIIGFDGSAKSVLDLVGNYISYFTGPACAIFIVGIFSSRVNDNTMFNSAIFGFFFNLGLSVLYPIYWLWYPFIGFLATAIPALLFSISVQEQNLQYTIWNYKEKIINNLKLDGYVCAVVIFLIIQTAIAFICTK